MVGNQVFFAHVTFFVQVKTLNKQLEHLGPELGKAGVDDYKLRVII